MLLIPAVFAVLSGLFLYWMYRQGYALTKSLTALLFVLRRGKTADRVSLNSCTGWARHCFRVRGSGPCTFTLNCRLSKGEAAAVLLDGRGRELLRLSPGAASGQVTLDGSGPYFLRWEFRKATGTCELRW